MLPVKLFPDEQLEKSPATTPVPVQLSGSEFIAFIFPHLSMPMRGPKCKHGLSSRLGHRSRICNRNACRYPVRARGPPWSTTRPSIRCWRNGLTIARLTRRSSPACGIGRSNTILISASCMAMHQHRRQKRRRWHRLFRPKPSEGREDHRHRGQQRLRAGSPARGAGE